MVRRLPDFIGIGPAHGGTTWLHWVLKARVGLPLPKKETHFFDRHYVKGIDWYSERFAHCADAAVVAEICTYFPSHQACERIALDLPNCKIICQLRDPTDRAYSAYKFALYNELTHDDFEQALETTPDITDGDLYARNLAKWYGAFSKERVLVLLFDDLRRRPQTYIDRICEFVGVPRVDLASLELPARAINAHSLKPRSPSLARKGRRAINWLRDRELDRTVALLDRIGLWKLCFAGAFPPMNPATEQMLRERYLPEIEALEKLIGRDLSGWKPRPPRPEWFVP
jgi:Sulfotransferase domain